MILGNNFDLGGSMRSIGLFLGITLLSSFAMAYTDGTFACGETIFKIKTLTLSGINTPYMETTIQTNEKTYQIKGPAIVVSNSDGTEELSHSLGGPLRIEFNNNKTSCQRVK